ncbi:MAG: hypothetical protein WBD53_20405 [Xanthobacteraceae bacterium]
MSVKNRLTAADAQRVEDAFADKLASLQGHESETADPIASISLCYLLLQNQAKSLFSLSMIGRCAQSSWPVFLENLPVSGKKQVMLNLLPPFCSPASQSPIVAAAGTVLARFGWTLASTLSINVGILPPPPLEPIDCAPEGATPPHGETQ